MKDVTLNIRYLVVLTLTLCVTACGSGGEPDVVGGELSVRRLTAEQYLNAIEDTFGPGLKVSGRFEPEVRHKGLNALGTSRVSITPSGFEQYEAMAGSIAEQVTSAKLRDKLLPCAPQDASASDNNCATDIIRTFGPQILRRSLSEQDITVRVEAANKAADAQKDFYAGVRMALTTFLVSMDFLFRVEEGESAPLPEKPKRLELTGETLASRLSYFLWNRGPDAELLAAAASGQLQTPEGLSAQVDRMLTSEYLEGGVRAFFDDVLRFDKFDELDKDATRYPLYTAAMGKDAQEQTLRFITQKLLDEQAAYPSLYTSRDLPITLSLGPVYGVPVRVYEGWEEVTVPEERPWAGLLSHASISMLTSHPGRSSPTLRGQFMREALLCQHIPEAPADVDFTLFVDAEAQGAPTARERLVAHSLEPSCSKCHKLTDPIGLSLEVFDGIGQLRLEENGVQIDTSGNFDGTNFSGPTELGVAFSESPLVGACLVQNMYRYAVGREQTNPERPLLRSLKNQFAEQEYKVPELMRNIALSTGFRTATATTPAAQTAKAVSSPSEQTTQVQAQAQNSTLANTPIRGATL